MKSHSKSSVVRNSQLKAGGDPRLSSQVEVRRLAKKTKETHMNMPSARCQSLTRATIEGTDR